MLFADGSPLNPSKIFNELFSPQSPDWIKVPCGGVLASMLWHITSSPVVNHLSALETRIAEKIHLPRKTMMMTRISIVPPPGITLTAMDADFLASGKYSDAAREQYVSRSKNKLAELKRSLTTPFCAAGTHGKFGMADPDIMPTLEYENTLAYGMEIHMPKRTLRKLQDYYARHLAPK
jgi:hypothetical protein